MPAPARRIRSSAKPIPTGSTTTTCSVFSTDGEFLWGSERDGFCHLYLYSLDGKQRKRLTEGDWEVTEVAGVDEAQQKIYFVSTEASPLERQLYSIKFNGKDRARISQGAGTHAISMGPAAEYYLDDFSSLTQPPRSTVQRRLAARVVGLSRGGPQPDRQVRASASGDRQLQGA